MPDKVRVLLVTSWGRPQCGIQAHSEMLIAAVKEADPELEILPSEAALNPFDASVTIPARPHILHLNYHRALHSRWTPNVLRVWKEHHPDIKRVITFHDTFGENPPDQLTSDLYYYADAFVVHEPCQGLESAIYWRQGVPEHAGYVGYEHPEYRARPILGSVGFDFPWKNYTLMARLAAECGWGLHLFVPEMSEEREAELKRENPWVCVRRNEPLQLVLASLSLCDATAFLYVCGNSGTSAAIRLGIAAKKPLYAFSTCRQFRDLHQDTVGLISINWMQSFEEWQDWLGNESLGGRFDPSITRLAEQDSWRHLGAKYAALYRSLACPS